jgi:hypothetical protein
MSHRGAPTIRPCPMAAHILLKGKHRLSRAISFGTPPPAMSFSGKRITMPQDK